jgi:hypothetical protein
MKVTWLKAIGYGTRDGCPSHLSFPEKIILNLLTQV